MTTKDDYISKTDLIITFLSVYPGRYTHEQVESIYRDATTDDKYLKRGHIGMVESVTPQTRHARKIMKSFIIPYGLWEAMLDEWPRWTGIIVALIGIICSFILGKLF